MQFQKLTVRKPSMALSLSEYSDVRHSLSILCDFKLYPRVIQCVSYASLGLKLPLPTVSIFDSKFDRATNPTIPKLTAS